MRYTFASILLLSCTLSAAQSTLTTPLDPDTTANRTTTRNLPASLPDLQPPPMPLNQQPESGVEFTKPVAPSQRFVGPITTRSEFQKFAEDAAGRPLPVYGRALFFQVPTTFAPADNIPVPADYVIGPGDELIVRIWGKINLDTRLTVDRNGQISIPRVGTLAVAGLHYDQLESRLRSAVGNLYRDFEINATLGRLRSIQIYVLGSARQPGAYTVSSLSTLVGALFTCGGPSSTGSMRLVQLRRNNQVLTEFDIYDLLRKGDKSHDVPLLPGDVIYIPPAGPQVAVFGSINEPGIYELRPDATIDSALQAAGGLTSLAGTQRIVVERLQDHSSRHIEEFALDAPGLRRSTNDGDLMRIFPISPQFQNSVTLKGSVAQPGRYAWREHMRVSDLIPSRETLITRDYWNQQNHSIVADNSEPFATRAGNRYREEVLRQSQLEREFRSNTVAAERPRQTSTNPPLTRPFSTRDPNQLNTQESEDTTKLSVQTDEADSTTIASIGKNSAEINWDYAVIERLDQRDLSTHLIPFRLAAAMDDPSSPDNQELKPGDTVTIFARADLELPMEKHASFVRVGGEVNAPGVYRVNPGETLQEVVHRAGGLTTHSYLYASKFTRLSARHAEEEQLRQSSEQMQKELISRYANAGTSAGQNAADQQAQLSLQQAAIARLSAIKPTGRVVLQMKPSASSLEDIPSLPLEDGDAFYVPPRLSTVQVAGSVYNPNAFRFQSGKKLGSYLNDAGGPTREADKRRIFVIRADGIVISRQSSRSHFHGNFENLNLQPGDAIVVPEKLRTPGAKGILQFTQGVSQAAITAAALSTVLP
jgi:polysaccharide biosynthesis/export protein